MTPFYEHFERIHAAPGSWLGLYEMLQAAQKALPKSSFMPIVLHRANEKYDESLHRSLNESFQPFSIEVAVAAAERFQDGSWPENLSDGAAYFLSAILGFAMLTIASFAPTPGRPLTPTIIPFPDSSIPEAALWFATEWWTTRGGYLYETEMRKKSRPNDSGLSGQPC